MLFVLRKCFHDIGDQCCHKHSCRIIPERISVTFDRAEIFCKHFDVLCIVRIGLVCVTFYAGERVISHGRLIHFCKVQVPDFITLLFQMWRQPSGKGIFCVYDDHAFVGMEDIGYYISSGFSGAADADYQVIVVEACLPGIVVYVAALCQDTVIIVQSSAYRFHKSCSFISHCSDLLFLLMILLWILFLLF